MYTKKNGRMTYKTNRRPNFKRNNNYSSKGRNKGNVTQQYNKYLKLAPIEVRAGPKQLPQIVLFIGIRNWGVLK